MRRTNGKFHSWQLYFIESFMCEVAQSIWGGEKTGPNDRDGDLYDSARGAYAEVKASCQSGGAIIRKSQLDRHCKGLEHLDRDYVLGFYRNKGKDAQGKFRSLTCRVGKTRRLLEDFLVERTDEIYIVHISVVSALYQRLRGREEREWHMKEGPRRGLKMRANRFRPFIDDVQRLAKIGLDPSDYIVERTPETARFGKRRIPVTVSRIVRV